MRKRWNVVTGTTLLVVAAAGLGAGLSFGFGGDHVAARAANPQVRHAPHEVVRGPRGPQGPQGPAAKSGAATAGRCGSTCFTMYSLRFGQTATLNAVINAND